eukprot:9380921-Heterocapsa_arctica.AAC.1
MSNEEEDRPRAAAPSDSHSSPGPRAEQLDGSNRPTAHSARQPHQRKGAHLPHRLHTHAGEHPRGTPGPPQAQSSPGPS